MTDLERLIELVERGIETSRIRLTTHERDIFDGIRRRSTEHGYPMQLMPPEPAFPTTTQVIEDNRNPAMAAHLNRLLREAINR